MQKSYQFVLNLFLVIGFSLFAIAWHPAIALAAPIIPHPVELVHAVQEIEALDAMRIGLASRLEGSTEEPTQQTMKEVCRPVGMQAIQGSVSDLLEGMMGLDRKFVSIDK